MKINQIVRLDAFNGAVAPRGDEDVRDDENYWLLIGKTGVVVSIDEPEALKAVGGGPRVLVQFHESVSKLGLACHNSIENSLWISVSDLKLTE